MVVSAQAPVAAARRQSAAALQARLQAARAERDRARAADRALAEQVDRLKRWALVTNRAAVQLRELERDVEANRQVYQAFLLRARETGEQTGVDSTNARIISAASPSLIKAGPNRTLMAGLGLFLGLGLGAMVGLARDVASGRLAFPAADRAQPDLPETKSAGTAVDQIEGVSPTAPANGAAPSAAARVSRGRWRQPGEPDATPAPDAEQAVAQPPAPIGIALPVGTKRGWRSSTVARSAFHGGALSPFVWDEPSSGFASRIREIRDRLAMEETSGQNRKVVVIGLEPGAGTSLVALNLALAAAKEKATPILVDLATGPASLSAQFAPDAGLGADEVMAGACGLIRAALQDDASGAFFLPRLGGAGRRAIPTPAQLRTQLFEQMKRFDPVVIDAGSLLDGAMPYLLAELCDDIVVVAPPGLDPPFVSQRIQRALGPDAGKVRVIVTNAGASRAVSASSSLKVVPA